MKNEFHDKTIQKLQKKNICEKTRKKWNLSISRQDENNTFYQTTVNEIVQKIFDIILKKFVELTFSWVFRRIFLSEYRDVWKLRQILSINNFSFKNASVDSSSEHSARKSIECSYIRNKFESTFKSDFFHNWDWNTRINEHKYQWMNIMNTIKIISNRLWYIEMQIF